MSGTAAVEAKRVRVGEFVRIAIGDVQSQDDALVSRDGAIANHDVCRRLTELRFGRPGEAQQLLDSFRKIGNLDGLLQQREPGVRQKRRQRVCQGDEHLHGPWRRAPESGRKLDDGFPRRRGQRIVVWLAGGIEDHAGQRRQARAVVRCRDARDLERESPRVSFHQVHRLANRERVCQTIRRKRELLFPRLDRGRR
jgi:hypothetical protein